MKEIGSKVASLLKKGDEISKKMFMYQVGRPNENGFGPRVPQSLGVDGWNSHTNICSAGAREGTIQWTIDDRNSPDWVKCKVNSFSNLPASRTAWFNLTFQTGQQARNLARRA